MATSSQLKQRQLARRTTSDIDRLAKQYKTNLDALTGEYQTAFTGYQAGAAEKTKTYEAQVDQYRRALEAYQSDVVTPYNKAAEKYNADRVAYLNELSEIQSGARDRYARTYDVRYRQGGQQIVDTRIKNPFTGVEISPFGANKDVRENPEKYGLELFEHGGKRGENEYRFRPLPTTQAPKEVQRPAEFSMKAPESPDVGEFDSTAFEEKRKSLGNTFQREVGERRAAKIGAVSRRATRPLLSGEQA